MEEANWFIYWEDISIAKFKIFLAGKHKSKVNCLYQITGFHSIYGPDSLLYIGQTADLECRLKNHFWWIEFEPEVVQIKKGEIGLFKSYSQIEKNIKLKEKGFFPGQDNNAFLLKIEKLLIFACAPSYNCSGIANPDTVRKFFGKTELRIFNLGKSAPLPREISTRFWLYSNKEYARVRTKAVKKRQRSAKKKHKDH